MVPRRRVDKTGIVVSYNSARIVTDMRLLNTLRIFINQKSHIKLALSFISIGVFTVVGVILLFSTKAFAPSVASLEAETGNIAYGIQILNNSDESGGRAVKFGSNSVSTCNGVIVNPGDNIQSKVDSSPPHTTFCINAGTYREQMVVLPNINKPAGSADGDTFIGVGNVVMSGSKILTGFISSGSTWYVGGQVQTNPTYTRANCNMNATTTDTSLKCTHPEDVFIDDVPLARVSTLNAVTSNTWFFDYAAQRVYIGSNPSGKTVELSTTKYAFSVSKSSPASNINIKNLTVEKYANLAQSGAIMAGQDPWNGSAGVSNWIIDGVTARRNHGAGIAYSNHTGIIIRNSKANDNYQTGIKGTTSTNSTITGNEMARNNTNTLKYLYGWEAGGGKFTKSTGTTISNNNAHDNYGAGLWTDIENRDVVYDGNTVSNNANAGIFHEISYNAIIRNNVVNSNNGWLRSGDWCWGAGIQIANSSDVEVYNNNLSNNNNSIIGTYVPRGNDSRGSPYVLSGLNVHNNNTTASSTSMTGICRNLSTGDSVFASNNHFSSDTYSGAGIVWRWSPTTNITSFSNWQSYNSNDVGGSYTP